MASIDWGMIGLGALIGVGCREQLATAGRVAASTAASLANVAAQTAAQVAQETAKSQEQAAADAMLQRVDRYIAQQMGEVTGQQQAAEQNGQNQKKKN